MIFCCRSLSWVYGTGARQSAVLLAIAVSALSFAHPNRERWIGNISSNYEWTTDRTASPGTGMPTKDKRTSGRAPARLWSANGSHDCHGVANADNHESSAAWSR